MDGNWTDNYSDEWEAEFKICIGLNISCYPQVVLLDNT